MVKTNDPKKVSKNSQIQPNKTDAKKSLDKDKTRKLDKTNTKDKTHDTKTLEQKGDDKNTSQNSTAHEKQKKQRLFKCANDITVKISKFSGEVLLCEECCTSLSIILKNDGNIATSFLGSHSPELVKVLERCIKRYFKGLKKTLKQEYNRVDNEEIKVVKDYTESTTSAQNATEKKVVDLRVGNKSGSERSKSVKTSRKKSKNK